MTASSGEQSISSAIARVEAAGGEGGLSAGSVENIGRWLTEPQYRQYVPQIVALIESGNFDALDALFWEVIPFGTGGRRGPMAEFGSATINERTIAESAHGLGVYSNRARNAQGGRAVVACDSRNRSDEFARLTATTLAAHGYKVFFFASNRSTPELSFAVRHLACDVGAMISASHNPPADNGFKAYWSNGAQVLPPHDKGIIDCVYEAGEIPATDFNRAVADGKIEVIGENVDRPYIDAVKSLSLSDKRKLRAIFSPLHGVGETSVYRVLRESGFDGIDIFGPHREPNGNFPNVPDQMPNPERPQVFAPLIASADEAGIGLVMASDPDADRLGASVRGGDGKFVHLTGNIIGALLADYVIRRRKELGTLSNENYVVETLVTTPLIGAIARKHGLRVFDNLLVGFKYIAETMDAHDPGKFVFGAEESLGYLAGEYCRDKDAAVAALFLSELAAELQVAGKTLLDRLDELFAEYGYYVEGQRSEVCEGSRGKEQIDALMRAFRQSPPTELAGIRLGQVRDFQTHEIRTLPENRKAADLPEPRGNVLFFESCGGATSIRIAVRPSGTEPKIKFYFFASAGAGGDCDLAALKDRTNAQLADCQQTLSAWVRDRLAENPPA